MSMTSSITSAHDRIVRDQAAGAEFESFLSCCAMRKVQVGQSGSRQWHCFDAGPRSSECPLVMLPPLSGRATCYYKQLMGLSALGYRVIAMEWGPCWSVGDFCKDFFEVLEGLRIKQCHIFGSSLGGYLAQRLAEIPVLSGQEPVVKSLILCNAFTNTAIFDRETSSLFFWATPSVFLKHMVMSGFPKKALESHIANSVDFMVDNLDSFEQSDLASRLTLNCSVSYVDTARVGKLPITLIDVFDDCALSRRAIEEMHKAYPNAKRAHLKDGGNFPYLSRPAEIDMYIQLHLRQFDNTSSSAKGEHSQGETATYEQ